MLMMQAALIFLGLSTFYWLLYKYLAWRRSFIEPVATRVRLWVYLLIPLCTLNWIGARVYHDWLAQSAVQSWITWLPRYIIIALLIIIVVETLFVLLFDYYYAGRRQLAVPPTIQTLARALLYTLIGLLVLLTFFNIKVIAEMLIGSGVLLLGVAWLMQDALRNLFAGLGLQTTRLFAPGDWLRVGAHEGRVESLDWRAVTLRGALGESITVPMSLLAQVEVTNLTARHAPSAGEVDVVVDFAYPPEQVERVLHAALRDIDGLCAEPAPEVRLAAFQEQGIRYVIRYWFSEGARRAALATAVHRAIWYHFRRAEIRLAYPATNVYLHQPASAVCSPGERVALLRRIAFLQSLPAEQMERLACALRQHLFARGETVCRQGEPGQTFYIITRGRLRVSACAGGQEIFTQTLAVGHFVGEFSLLTGEPRTATVTVEEEAELLVMDKEDMRQILADNPTLAEHISAILAQRRHELQASHAKLPVAPGAPLPAADSVDSLQQELLRNILSFFSY